MDELPTPGIVIAVLPGCAMKAVAAGADINLCRALLLQKGSLEDCYGELWRLDGDEARERVSDSFWSPGSPLFAYEGEFIFASSDGRGIELGDDFVHVGNT
ncbi:MAG: hypothetical protein ACI841_004451 [Planctomycetota bacterium]|jgi:hypothetical protein